MQTIYKIFLVFFIICLGCCFAGINWRLGFMHNENTKFVFSIAASIIGIIGVFVLNTWSKLARRKDHK
ncbi:hypothetical protein [Riemerella columbipharyngis]|uniref:Uncharacterized protein n=1 Tax=Riemerella columbipharyngis TaxID=1071918 RepID=A0A1G7BU79_9FLAO|nr:hypothetical protein [Riemerella columbipharyngis]SDE30522.1 hypothetical protein SAMN05421544_106124 [Riemerella columbipharyngis]